MYRLILNKFAETDIDISVNYYEEQKEGLGNDFLFELKDTIIRIKNNPY